jgi:diguanylate cyclase (GGDEF)-like protein
MSAAPSSASADPRSGSKKSLVYLLRQHWRSIAAWPVAAVVVGAVGWSVLASNLNSTLAQQRQEALLDAENLAQGYALTLSRTFDLIDQVILHVKFEREILGPKLFLESISDKGLFPDSSFFRVSITDSAGYVITSNIHRSPRKSLYVGDRPYFSEHQSSAQEKLVFGAPVIGRTTGREVLQLSRRLVDAKGAFNGIVQVSTQSKYFTMSYDGTVLQRHGLLAVVGTDGVLRSNRVGQSALSALQPIFAKIPKFDTPSGSAWMNSVSFKDKRSRFSGWAAVDKYPLFAVVGLDEAEFLAPYYTRRTAALQIATALTVAMGLATLVGMMLSLRLAQRKHELDQTRGTYRLATEGGHDGFYTARALFDVDGAVCDFQILDCNIQGADFFRRRPEQVIGARLSSFVDGRHGQLLRSGLVRAMEEGVYQGEAEGSSPGALGPICFEMKAVRVDGDLAVTLRDVSDAKAHVAELVRRGNEDVLTALPNRHWLESYLPAAIQLAAANTQRIAILFIDLDGFKAVNDSFGHAAGDELLRKAGQRLKLAVRPHDKVVRFGGDEFIVIVEAIHERDDAAHVAERILRAFRDPFLLQQGPQSVGTSIGISLYPEDGQEPEGLLKSADVAMYSVKTSGKRNYRFYDQKFYEAMREKQTLENELRVALERDEFVVYYQPRVHIRSQATASIEALVRWAHPTRGMVEPVDFISLAEETGLIHAIGELVFDKVCGQMALWAQGGTPLIPVSINVSFRQFSETDLLKVVTAAVAKHQLSASLIEIELTESSMMGDSPAISATLAAFQRMGIKLLIDDFGTGYSSLSQLQKLDFDVLKVDRAFTAQLHEGPQGCALFSAIITMAHALGMTVVAEGVETEAQHKILAGLNCDEVQGFYIGRPAPPGAHQPIVGQYGQPELSFTPASFAKLP